MNASVQDPPQAEAQRGAHKQYTGFPEPLSPDRNTTLPHPDADTSGNAAIGADDVPLTRTHSRIRSMSSLHRHNRSVSTNSGIVSSPTVDGALVNGVAVAGSNGHKEVDGRKDSGLGEGNMDGHDGRSVLEETNEHGHKHGHKHGAWKKGLFKVF